jgi:hypothetical protein
MSGAAGGEVEGVRRPVVLVATTRASTRSSRAFIPRTRPASPNRRGRSLPARHRERRAGLDRPDVVGGEVAGGEGGELGAGVEFGARVLDQVGDRAGDLVDRLGVGQGARVGAAVQGVGAERGGDDAGEDGADVDAGEPARSSRRSEVMSELAAALAALYALWTGSPESSGIAMLLSGERSGRSGGFCFDSSRVRSLGDAGHQERKLD